MNTKVLADLREKLERETEKVKKYQALAKEAGLKVRQLGQEIESCEIGILGARAYQADITPQDLDGMIAAYLANKKTFKEELDAAGEDSAV